MKLHLPTRLRAAVLACITAVAALTSTIGTGVVAVGSVTYVMAAAQAKADYTFGGTIYTTTTSADNLSEAVFAETTYSGGEFEKTGNTAGWQTAGTGFHTLRFVAGEGQKETVKVNFNTLQLSGLIVEAGAVTNMLKHNGYARTYILGQSGQNSDSVINADFAMNCDLIQLQGSQTWNIAAEKTLTLQVNPSNGQGKVEVLANSALTITGGGTVAVTEARLVLNTSTSLTLTNGASLSVAKALNLDLTGATTDGGLIINAEGCVVSATGGLTLSNYGGLASGTYQLIKTTDEAATTLAESFQSSAKYSVTNVDGVVTLTVVEGAIPVTGEEHVAYNVATPMEDGYVVKEGGNLSIDNGSGGKGTGGNLGGKTTNIGAVTVEEGGTLTIYAWDWSWLDLRTDNKCLMAQDVTLQGGTMYIKDGAYIFTGDLTVSGDATIELGRAKGQGFNSLKGDADSTLTIELKSDWGGADAGSAAVVNLINANAEFAGTLNLKNSDDRDKPSAIHLGLSHADALSNAHLTFDAESAEKAAINLVLNTASASVLSLSGKGNIITSSEMKGVNVVAGEVTEGALTLSGTAAEGAAAFTGTISDKVTLTVAEGAQLSLGDVTLGTTIANSGTVSMTEGAVITLSSLTHMSGDRELSEGDNGFETLTSIYVVSGGTLNATGVMVQVGEEQKELQADGSIACSGETDYTVYHLNTGSKSMADIAEAATQGGGALEKVALKAGTTLTDISSASGLSGDATFSADTEVTADGGIPAAVEADATYGNLAGSGTISLNNGSTLTVTGVDSANVSINLASADSKVVFTKGVAETAEMTMGDITAGSAPNNFGREVVVEEDVTLNITSLNNGWGMKGITVDGVLNVEETLQYTTGNNKSGYTENPSNLISGSGSITTKNLTIGQQDNDSFNTINVNSLTVTGDAHFTGWNDDATHTYVTGGTMTVLGNTSVTARWGGSALIVDGGTVVLGDAEAETPSTVTLSGGKVKVDSGSLTINGDTTIESHGDSDGLLSVNGGTLTINGSVDGDITATAGVVEFGAAEMTVGGLDLSFDSTSTAHLVVKSDASATMTDSLWLYSANDGVVLEANASLTTADGVTMTGGESGGSLKITETGNEESPHRQGVYTMENGDFALSDAAVSVAKEDASTLATQLSNVSVENKGTGTLTVIADGESSITDVAATSGDIIINGRTEETVLALDSVTLGAGTSVTLDRAVTIGEVTVDLATYVTEAPAEALTLISTAAETLLTITTLDTDIQTVRLGEEDYYAQLALEGNSLTLTYTKVESLYWNGSDGNLSDAAWDIEGGESADKPFVGSHPLVFAGESGTITVDEAATVGNVTVEGAYEFTNSADLTINGTLTVEEDATATFDAEPTATSVSVAGTLDLTAVALGGADGHFASILSKTTGEGTLELAADAAETVVLAADAAVQVAQLNIAGQLNITSADAADPSTLSVATDKALTVTDGQLVLVDAAVSVAGGALEAKEGIALGHDADTAAGAVVMTGGSLTTKNIALAHDDAQNTVTVTGGTLVITDDKAFSGTGAATTVSISNATLSTDGEHSWALNHDATLTDVTVAAEEGTSITLGGDGLTTTINGTLTNAGALVLGSDFTLGALDNSDGSIDLGSHTLTLTAATEDGGTLTGEAGTLILAGANTFDALTLGTLDISASGASATVGTLSAGSVTLNALTNALSIGSVEGDLSFAATVDMLNNGEHGIATLTGEEASFGATSLVIGEQTINLDDLAPVAITGTDQLVSLKVSEDGKTLSVVVAYNGDEWVTEEDPETHVAEWTTETSQGKDALKFGGKGNAEVTIAEDITIGSVVVDSETAAVDYTFSGEHSVTANKLDMSTGSSTLTVETDMTVNEKATIGGETAADTATLTVAGEAFVEMKEVNVGANGGLILNDTAELEIGTLTLNGTLSVNGGSAAIETATTGSNTIVIAEPATMQVGTLNGAETTVQLAGALNVVEGDIKKIEGIADGGDTAYGDLTVGAIATTYGSQDPVTTEVTLAEASDVQNLTVTDTGKLTYNGDLTVHGDIMSAGEVAYSTVKGNWPGLTIKGNMTVTGGSLVANSLTMDGKENASLEVTGTGTLVKAESTSVLDVKDIKVTEGAVIELALSPSIKAGSVQVGDATEGAPAGGKIVIYNGSITADDVTISNGGSIAAATGNKRCSIVTDSLTIQGEGSLADIKSLTAKTSDNTTTTTVTVKDGGVLRAQQTVAATNVTVSGSESKLDGENATVKATTLKVDKGASLTIGSVQATNATVSGTGTTATICGGGIDVSAGTLNVLDGASLNLAADVNGCVFDNTVVKKLEVGKNSSVSTAKDMYTSDNGDITVKEELKMASSSTLTVAGTLKVGEVKDNLKTGVISDSAGSITAETLDLSSLKDAATITNLKANAITLSDFDMLTVTKSLDSIEGKDPVAVTLTMADADVKSLTLGDYTLVKGVAGAAYTLTNVEDLNKLMIPNDKRILVDTSKGDLVVQVTDYKMQAMLGETETGCAGLALANGANHTKLDPKGDLVAIVAKLATLREEESPAAKTEGDKIGAALSGASVAALGAALSGDVERQLKAIRNRTTVMGVSQAVVNEDMPYLNAWVNAEGDYRDISADGTMPGYKLNSWGGTVGFDVDCTPTFTCGLAATAMYGDFTSTGEDHAEGDLNTYYVSAFGRYAKHRWTHTFMATAGMADTSLDRTVCGAKVKGDSEGTMFGGMYEVGYVFALDKEATTCLQPIVNVSYTHASLSGYEESGSDVGLKTSDVELNKLTVGAGARLQSVIGESIYNRSSIFEARALVKFDAGDRQGEVTNSFVKYGSSASTKSVETGALGGEFGMGVTVPVGSEGGNIFMDASAEIRADYVNVNGTVGYRVNF